jgi:mercuric ion transport protein
MDNWVKGKLATSASYLGILGASTCCILPFIFLSLGLTGFGAGLFEVFSPYQNWFLGFSFVSILAGLHFTHQKTGIFNESKSTTRMKKLLWVALVLIPVTYFWQDYIEPLFGA